MNIILGRERADALRERFTVLELENFEHPDGMLIEAFCVVPAEKIPLAELATLDQWINLHGSFIAEMKKGNVNFCTQAIEHLRGKFGGEMDTFYDHMMSKIQ